MNDTASKPESPWRADKQPPFSDLIGMKVTVVSPEKITATLVVREELTNRNGVMHGGAVMALADNMGGTAAVANLSEGFITSTIESKTNFVGPAPLGATVIGETTPIHRGRRTMVWQTRITTAEGKLVAVVTQTQMVL